ncbi:hypothetical protein [Ornithinibacillus caprae]|uniref:hypothetical protein n=1 Tax=Ornithinibacillus caprae TaxID=2678566 RepID=UPI0018C707E4|nr:hypothetical protein [Ornithinibacillus caprae]
MSNEGVGVVFISCLLLGAGLGTLFGSFEFGGLIGLGIGLIIVLLYRTKRPDNH